MTTLYCPNEDCPEYGLPKDDPDGISADGPVYCGGCGQEVTPEPPEEREARP